MIIADLICLVGEKFDSSKPLMIFDPIENWKKTFLKAGAYTMKEILVPIFKDGECVYESPKVMEIREFCKKELASLWEESKRFKYPHQTYVDLSKKLWNLKNDLLEHYQFGESTQS